MSCSHRFLLVEDLTELYHFARCLDCGNEITRTEEFLNRHYLAFVHNSINGPESDETLLIRCSIIEHLRKEYLP